MDKVKQFWDTCVESYAHLSKSISDSEKYHYGLACNGISKELANKTVADYGIGGGYLGEYLFKNFNISKYIGIDISERSIEKASGNLSEFASRCAFALVPVDFSELNADFLFSLACIQHFPGKEYVENFFKSINSSGIPNVILQIRKGDCVLINETSYDRNVMGDVTKATILTPDYVSDFLENYNLISAIDSNEVNNYCYLRFKLK